MKKRRRQSDPALAKARLERVISVTTLAEAGNDRDYWLRQSIHARLHHMELPPDQLWQSGYPTHEEGV